MNRNNIKEKAVCVYRKAVMVAGFVYVMISNTYTVYAADDSTSADATAIVNQVTGPINLLTTVFISIFASFGVVMLVKVVPELIAAIQSQDNSGIFHAARGIGCALLLIALPIIIKLFA